MMTDKKDIYIKDEGDFVTIICQTDKAKAIISKNIKIENNKLNILIENIPSIITWAITHGLSIDSEVSIHIPKLNVK